MLCVDACFSRELFRALRGNIFVLKGQLNERCVYVKVAQSCSTFGHVTLWTVAYQAPLSMELARPEYWSG